MRFDLTDDQKSLREVLQSFFERKFGAAQGIEATATLELDRALWTEICELGLGGILVSEENGGLGMGLLTLAVAAETLGSCAVPAPVVPAAIAAWLIARNGSPAQRDSWLGGLLTGEIIPAFALAEADGPGLDAWRIGNPATGTKLNVERAADADLLIVGTAGGGLGLVGRDAAGLSLVPADPLDRSRPFASVEFDGVSLDPLDCDAMTVGKLIDALLVTYAADALGAATAIQRRAVDYAKERKQYGQLIGAFQALKHQLADMSVELEPARPLVWYAAYGWDTDRPDAHRIAAITKAHLGEVSVNVSRAAIEAFGGIGYTWEFPAHLFLKRAMTDRSALGTPAYHRERAASLAGWRGQDERIEDRVAKAGRAGAPQRAVAGAD
jgi:alkylation response protein AidB-like acyl-CoA dehydrogenase